MAGTIRLMGRLGSGGIGQVFLGATQAGRTVAVKVIHPELAADPAFRARFRAEVAAARLVSGAYTAPVVAAGPDDDPPWMATVFVEGPSLADAVTTAGPLPPGSVWRLAAGLVEALDAIHGRGLVHRDLKPSNILLADDGPRVIDFGISRALDGTALTATGHVVGTPTYMSPEQASGAPIGPASDVFSLGAVLAFAASGSGPFGDGDPTQVLYRIMHAEPELAGVPRELRQLVAACLAKDPAARPTLPALAQAIAVGPRSVPDKPPSADASPAMPSRLNRRRALLGLAGAGAIGLAAVGWELSRGSGSSHLAGQTSASSTRVAPRPTPSPSASGPPAWLARLAPGEKIWGVLPAGGLESAPATAGGVVYVLGADGTSLYALRGDSGSKLWSKDIKSGILTFAAAPGTVYVTGIDNSLHALRASDGGTLWSGQIGGGGAAQGPVVDGDRLYVVSASDDSVYAVNAISGAALWRVGLNGMPAFDPVVAGGAVFIADAGGNVYAIGSARGNVLWTASVKGRTSSPATVIPVTPPVVGNGVVYIATVDRVLYALRADHGKRLWTTGMEAAGWLLGVADGTIYVSGIDGHLNALNANRHGATSWSVRVTGGIQSTPLMADGTIYVPSADHRVYAVRAADGSILWSTGIGGGAQFPVVAAGGILYISGYDRKLYAVRG